MTEPAADDEKRKKIIGLHPNVFFMGVTSLLTDISSELIFTLVPLFMSNVLGASSTLIGIAPILFFVLSAVGSAIKSASVN
jgi:hypothetical protein